MDTSQQYTIETIKSRIQEKREEIQGLMDILLGLQKEKKETPDIIEDPLATQRIFMALGAPRFSTEHTTGHLIMAAESREKAEEMMKESFTYQEFSMELHEIGILHLKVHGLFWGERWENTIIASKSR